MHLLSRSTKILSAAALLLWLAAGCAHPTALRAPQDELQRELDDARKKLFQEWPEQTPVGIAFYVTDGQDELFLTSGLPPGISPDSHYRVASMTKNFTAAAILLLAQEGKLRLDDTLTTPMPGRTEPYVPPTADFDFPYKDQITIRQLLRHNAGFYDLTNDEVKTDEKVPYANGDYIEWMERQDPLHRFTIAEMVGIQSRFHLAYGKPGTSNYSNMGFGLLAVIAERAAGRDFAAFVEERLLAPNRLDHTRIPVAGSDRTLPAPFLPGYRREKDGRVLPATERNPSVFPGSGNMISTMRDMAQWLRRLHTAQGGLNPATLKEMTGDGKLDYALGTMRFHQTAFGHNGVFNGYFSCHYYDTATGLSWVLVCNAMSGGIADQLEVLNAFQSKMLERYAEQRKSNR